MLCPVQLSALCNSNFCSLPGSSVYGIFQARIGEWVAISYSGWFSRLKDRTCISCISCIGKWILYCCNTWGAQSGNWRDFEDSLTWMNLASGFGLHPQKEFFPGPGKGIWYTKVLQSCQESQWQVKNICMAVHLIYKELQKWIPLQLLVNTFSSSSCQATRNFIYIYIYNVLNKGKILLFYNSNKSPLAQVSVQFVGSCNSP